MHCSTRCASPSAIGRPRTGSGWTFDREIADKFRKGYPRDNIIFSDDATAVLYQDGQETGRAAAMDDTDALFALVTRFFDHERAEVADFRKAVKQFARARSGQEAGKSTTEAPA